MCFSVGDIAKWAKPFDRRGRLLLRHEDVEIPHTSPCGVSIGLEQIATLEHEVLDSMGRKISKHELRSANPNRVFGPGVAGYSLDPLCCRVWPSVTRYGSVEQR